MRRFLYITLLELQFHFGDNPFKFQVVCPQIGTAVLKGISRSSGLCGECKRRAMRPRESQEICRRYIYFRNKQVTIFVVYAPLNPFTSAKLQPRCVDKSLEIIVGSTFLDEAVQNGLGPQSVPIRRQTTQQLAALSSSKRDCSPNACFGEKRL